MVIVFWSYDTALLCGENFYISGAFFVIGCCILFTLFFPQCRDETQRKYNFVVFGACSAGIDYFVWAVLPYVTPFIATAILDQSLNAWLPYIHLKKLLKCSKIEQTSIWKQVNRINLFYFATPCPGIFIWFAVAWFESIRSFYSNTLVPVCG